MPGSQSPKMSVGLIPRWGGKHWKTQKKHVETTNWLTHSPLIQVFGSLSWYVKHCKTQVSLYVVLTFPGSTDFYSSIREPSAMLCPTRGLVILVPNSERCLTCQRLDRLPNINRLVYRCLWDSLRLEPRCLLWKTGCCPKLSQGQYGLEGPLAVKRKYADCTSHCPAGMRWQCVDKIEMRTSTLKNEVQPCATRTKREGHAQGHWFNMWTYLKMWCWPVPQEAKSSHNLHLLMVAQGCTRLCPLWVCLQIGHPEMQLFIIRFSIKHPLNIH